MIDKTKYLVERQIYLVGAWYPLDTSRAIVQALTQSSTDSNWIVLILEHLVDAQVAASGSSQITIASSSPKAIRK